MCRTIHNTQQFVVVVVCSLFLFFFVCVWFFFCFFCISHLVLWEDFKWAAFHIGYWSNSLDLRWRLKSRWIIQPVFHFLTCQAGHSLGMCLKQKGKFQLEENKLKRESKDCKGLGVHMVTSLVSGVGIICGDLRIYRARESWNPHHWIKQQQWMMNADSYCIQVGYSLARSPLFGKTSGAGGGGCFGARPCQLQSNQHSNSGLHLLMFHFRKKESLSSNQALTW